MTREEFIKSLCDVFNENFEGVFLRARKAGWLEQEDDLFKDDTITRKNAARILHMYLLKVMEIPDLKDISGAEVLRDLYDCRVCANHVAQMYLRGIMDARPLDKDGSFRWFDLDDEVDDDSIALYLKRALETVTNSQKH